MTREDLANATGLAWGKLRSYEIGRSSIKNLPLKDALTIADVLDCTLQDLLDEVPTVSENAKTKLQAVPITREDPIRLEIMRSQKGLSRKDLSEITGISYPALQIYEQKRLTIDKITLWNGMLLAKALDCEPRELFD